MIKDVIINIKGTQGLDGETDVVEFTTEGKLGIRDEKYFLSYEEGQLLEGAKVKTKMLINSDTSVVLERKGDINSRMEIEKGERRTCFYGTPIGNITIGIYGEELDVNLSEKGGRIKLSYNIDSQLTPVSQNKVEITVKEV